MSDLNLSNSLTERIQALAAQEHRSVEEVLSRMLQSYSSQQQIPQPDETPDPDPLVGIIDLLSDDTQATDLSSTVRETLAQNTHPQYGWTKRGRTD